MAKGDHIEKLNDEKDLVRLHTYIPKELDRQLELGKVYDHGSKKDQASEAIRLYLAIFRGYGSLSSEERRQVREYLDRT